jgi:hypothetical protein
MQSLSYIAGMFSLRRISAAGLLFSLVGLGGLSSCLYNSKDRCDPGETFDPGSGLCICAGNTIAGDHSCTPCGENEVASDAGTCDCAPGFARANASAACMKGLGNPCSADADCTDPVYNSCHIDSGTTGYCTNLNCATNADCTSGYGCNTKTPPAYCEQPPTGAGMKCMTDADCAGTQATYCENHMSFTCFVQCSLTAGDCFPGQECCDLGPLSFGLVNKQICVDMGTCGGK